MVPMIEPVTRLCVDTPAGLVRVAAECADGKCRRVSFRNVPAFLMHRDAMVEVPGLGLLTVDLAYGGVIYVIVSAEVLGRSEEHTSELQSLMRNSNAVFCMKKNTEINSYKNNKYKLLSFD